MQSSSSPVNLAEVLGCLSLSDANTNAMVFPADGGIGVLDVFASMFLQGEEKLASWPSKHNQYNIPLAREKCAGVLLDLALSTRTATAVAHHAKLHAAVDHALSDSKNLTKKAKKLLEDTVFQIKMYRDEQPTSSQSRQPVEATRAGEVAAVASQDDVSDTGHTVGGNICASFTPSIHRRAAMNNSTKSATLSKQTGGSVSQHMRGELLYTPHPSAADVVECSGPSSATPQSLSEGFLLSLQVERERMASAERAAERAQRNAELERAERERAAEREFRLVVVAAITVCASAIVCAVMATKSSR